MHRTFHRTHIFLSLVSLRCVLLLSVSCDTFFSHAPHVGVPQDESPAALPQKPVIRTPCHSWVFPSLSSFSSTRPPAWTPSPATLTGIRPNPCATSPWGWTVWPSGRSHSSHIVHRWKSELRGAFEACYLHDRL